KPGVGPLLDMGPYYITALVALFGPVRRLVGYANSVAEKRVFDPKQPDYGKVFPVHTPTIATAILEFECGALSTFFITSECFNYIHKIELYGTDGFLFASDPNSFLTPIAYQPKNSDRREVQATHGYGDNSRGIGLMDMAYAIRNGRGFRPNGDFTRHVLEIMLSIMDSSRKGGYVDLKTTCVRPDPIKPGFNPDVLNY
ncbi:MAG: gfo/Idh/MocA family oxidoreductase, partial [Oscillospiraceae bacterium]|nr:gfo/Idh/MocA family oxidoreductase [Oscillospiraceae bacterium]